ncbi:MAG: SHOCT domain-containing protein [Burkholderiales bacterium]|nr:SHOCT domain-containing protein [Burkholderiales bacterium]MDE2453178.1 SHOCT domain-containing protein [Burkholderiales bacterium]
MMWNFGGVGAWCMGLGLVAMILFWALIVLAVAALVRWLSRGALSGRDATRGRTPLQIVQERYARGELDREEYEQKVKDLAP